MSAKAPRMPPIDTRQRVYEVLTGEDQGRVCKDIPDSACREQPRNFLTHVPSLAATKTADGLADPKLVLAWLLGATGAPAFMTGWLVPIRAAGALLPQLVIAASIRSMPVRKWVRAIGSIVQGAAAVGVGLAALLLEGAAAGCTILGLLMLMLMLMLMLLLLLLLMLLGSGLIERSVGVIAIAPGVVGLLAQRAGEVPLLLFAAMAALAVWLARGLDEVQQD